MSLYSLTNEEQDRHKNMLHEVWVLPHPKSDNRQLSSSISYPASYLTVVERVHSDAEAYYKSFAEGMVLILGTDSMEKKKKKKLKQLTHYVKTSSLYFPSQVQY